MWSGLQCRGAARQCLRVGCGHNGLRELHCPARIDSAIGLPLTGCLRHLPLGPRQDNAIRDVVQPGGPGLEACHHRCCAVLDGLPRLALECGGSARITVTFAIPSRRSACAPRGRKYRPGLRAAGRATATVRAVFRDDQRSRFGEVQHLPGNVVCRHRRGQRRAARRAGLRIMVDGGVGCLGRRKVLPGWPV